MFIDIPTGKWSLKQICENFQDWLLQGCLERDRADEQKVEEIRQDAHRMCEHND